MFSGKPIVALPNMVCNVILITLVMLICQKVSYSFDFNSRQIFDSLMVEFSHEIGNTNFIKAKALAEDMHLIAQKMGWNKELGFCYSELGRIEHINGRIDKSVNHYRSAIEHNLKANQQLIAADNYIVLGKIFNELKLFIPAFDEFSKALMISETEKDAGRMAISLANMGRAAFFAGRPEEATVNYFRAMKITEDLGNRQLHVMILTDFADIQASLNQSTKAIEFYLQALQLELSIVNRNNLSIAEILLNLGNLSQKLKETENAKNYYLDALGYLRMENPDINIQRQLHYRLGIIAADQNDYDRSNSHFKKCLNISTDNQNKEFEATVLFMLGKNFMSKENPAAVGYFEHSLKLANDNNLTYLMFDNYMALDGFYTRSGDFKQAYNYLKRYQNLRDSVNRREISRNHQLQISHYNDELAQLEIRIVEMQRENILRARIFIAIAIVLSLAVIILLFLTTYLKGKFKKFKHAVRELTREINRIEKENTVVRSN